MFDEGKEPAGTVTDPLDDNAPVLPPDHRLDERRSLAQDLYGVAMVGEQRPVCVPCGRERLAGVMEDVALSDA
jgi:hypothetical protein